VPPLVFGLPVLAVHGGELRTRTRKFPLPHAGSRKRESIRSVSSFTRSSIASTNWGGVNTSPWSATRALDLIRLMSNPSEAHGEEQVAVETGRYAEVFLRFTSELPNRAELLARIGPNEIRPIHSRI